MKKGRSGIFQCLNLAFKLFDVGACWMLLANLQCGGGISGSRLADCLRAFGFLRLDNMLGRGVIDPEAIGSLFDCLLLDVYHLDQLLALDGVHRVVASLALAWDRLAGLDAGSSGCGFRFNVADGGRQLRNTVLVGVGLGDLSENGLCRLL